MLWVSNVDKKIAIKNPKPSKLSFWALVESIKTVCAVLTATKSKDSPYWMNKVISKDALKMMTAPSST